jgi:glycosyltransferase involved in cell wall biosynthesis
MGEPSVSVLVPTYNAEPFLVQALDSLVEQRLDDIEVICINDGSTDRSAEILDEYARRDPRFIVIHKTNSGYGASMNIGLAHARGRYVGVLEPDDYAPSTMFEGLVSAGVRSGADIVKASYHAFQTEPRLVVRPVRLFARKLLKRVFRPIDEPSIFQVRPSIWAGIYRRDLLVRQGIRFLESPGASYQDAGFNFKVWAAAENALLLDEHYLHYRTDNAASSVKDKGKVWAVAEEYEDAAAFIARLPCAEVLAHIMQARRFESYRWNLERLDPEVRPEFFDHALSEYRMASDRGLLKREYFTKKNWQAVHELIDRPDALRDRQHLLLPVPARREGDERPAPLPPADVVTSPERDPDQLISVIIPVYNAQDYLVDCLDSLLAQTHAELEVICVDDGSTDLSMEILREYAYRDPRIEIVSQRNAGAGAARNAGLAIARGKYLSFLDSDDVFDPAMLQRARAACEERELDFCVVRSAWFETDKPSVRHPIKHAVRDHLLPSETVFDFEDIPRDVFGLFQGWAWDKLFRTSFVRAHALRFQELRTTNDMLFVFSALIRARRIGTLPETLAFQRRQVKTSLSRTRERSWDNYLRALEALRRDIEAVGLLDRLGQDFANYALQFSLWNLETLAGDTRSQLLERLVSSGFRELAILPNEPGYFYRVADYEKLCQLTEYASTADADEERHLASSR